MWMPGTLLDMLIDRDSGVDDQESLDFEHDPGAASDAPVSGPLLAVSDLCLDYPRDSRAPR
jgi:hypothetical protein